MLTQDGTFFSHTQLAASLLAGCLLLSTVSAIPAANRPARQVPSGVGIHRPLPDADGVSMHNGDDSKSRSQRSTLTNLIQCSKDNHAKQLSQFPTWKYSSEQMDAHTTYAATWEPILEPVAGCNGLDDNHLKEFKFLIVLEGSWVEYYNNNQLHFRAQGAFTIEESPKVVMDRVSYLLEQQFGTRVTAGRVLVAPELGQACETNDAYVDDGSDKTSTFKAMARAGVTPLASEAGILRLGAAVPSDQHTNWAVRRKTYCHSYASIGQLGNPESVFSLQKQPFLLDGSGRLWRDAAATLAHEFGHFFGLCSGGDHCLHAHSTNELTDIMSYDGSQGLEVRPQGSFLKFNTACTPMYTDQVCSTIKAAQGESVLRPQVHDSPYTGSFVNRLYTGLAVNEWHFVEIALVHSDGNTDQNRCEGSRDSFDAGWGRCETYTQGIINHAYCNSDWDGNNFAEEVCSECGKCVDQNSVVQLRWSNKAGVSWTLSTTSNPNELIVSDECPYKSVAGYTLARVEWDGDRISRIWGPYGEPYDRQ